MADAAEAPAAAPEDTLYHDIVASIQKTYDKEESPRGNNTASLAVHAAMARAMENVITGRNFTQDCQIDKEFVEQWARTQLLMKDKLDHIMRLYLLSTNSPSTLLRVTYQAADIEVVTPPVSQLKVKHNEACDRLKLALERLAYHLRHEYPVVEAEKQVAEGKKQSLNSPDSTVPEEYRATCVAAEDDKLRNFEQQINEIETSCLYYLGEEHKEMQHVNKTLAGGNGYHKIPTIDDVTPVDRNGNRAPLNDQQKEYDYKPHLDELREKFKSQEQKPPPAATGSKRGKKINFPIGSKVEVQWPSDKKWYSATITHHVGGAKPYQVKYDVDGKLEDNVAAKRIRNPGGTSPAPSPAAAPPRAPSKPRARTKKRPREEETA